MRTLFKQEVEMKNKLLSMAFVLLLLLVCNSMYSSWNDPISTLIIPFTISFLANMLYAYLSKKVARMSILDMINSILLDVSEQKGRMSKMVKGVTTRDIKNELQATINLLDNLKKIEERVLHD